MRGMIVGEGGRSTGVLLYKAFHNLLPTNLLSYFKKLMTVIIITQEIILSVSK